MPLFFSSEILSLLRLPPNGMRHPQAGEERTRDRDAVGHSAAMKNALDLACRVHAVLARFLITLLAFRLWVHLA